MKDDKKILGKRRRRCKICKKLKYNVSKVINPFDEDVKAIKNEQAICPSCYKILMDDI